MNDDGASPAVVGVAGNGRCSGVVVGPNFVLTSDHCVNAVGTPVAIVDATGTQVVGRVCAKSAQARLALVCCLPIQSTVARLASAIPSPGALVEIESRTPRQQAWRACSRVNDTSAAAFTIQSVSDLRVPASGDSGSPAFVDGALAGILQEVHGASGEIAAYTAIPPVADWVRSGIRQHEQACSQWIARARR